MMLAGVIFDRQNFKVRNPIVVLNSVSVVDMLSGREPSAQVRFHDDTVFKLEVIASTNRAVPIASDKAARVLFLSSALH
jgi:hypothetical protein